MRASDLPPVCLGYGRKSIARHASDLISVDRQRDAIERLAAERSERLIWFEDAEGHRSGRFERTRPDFLRLMRHIESEPGVRSVVVYRIDRAGRSVVLIDKLIKLCQAKDIAFVSIVDGIDSSRGMNAGEIFRVQALAMVAEYQANRAADDMRDAVAKFKQSGISWGYTPFGLTRSGRGYDARLVPNPDAPTVEALLTYYTTSPSYSDTAEAMTADLWSVYQRATQAERAELLRIVLDSVIVDTSKKSIAAFVPHADFAAMFEALSELGDLVYGSDGRRLSKRGLREYSLPDDPPQGTRRRAPSARRVGRSDDQLRA